MNAPVFGSRGITGLSCYFFDFANDSTTIPVSAVASARSLGVDFSTAANQKRNR
jgi:hypothetical protein